LAINGFVSLEGKKMSKSKGPLLTLKRAVDEYGADVTRLYILSTAEHVQDADWRNKDVDATKKQVERFYRMAIDAAKAEGATLPPTPGSKRVREPGGALVLSTPQEFGGEGELKLIDRWMLSKLQSRISETLDALDSIQTRRAVQNAFYLLMNDIKWYERRGGSKVRREVFKTWIRLLVPFIPHLCEEIWQEFEGGYVSLAPYPTPDLSLLDKEGELGEELITAALRDVDEIISLIKIKPKKVVLYTSHQWKIKILKKAVEMKKSGSLEMKTLMGEIMGDPSIRKHAKEAPKFAQRILTDIRGMNEVLINTFSEVELDEMVILREAKPFLEKEIGCQVEVYSADNPTYDPKRKSEQAIPMRPAIYIE
jgi:leucyl-tRNA synthetase